MQNYTFQNNSKEKRVKYCVYKKFYDFGKYELIAMTLDLTRVENLINKKFKEDLTSVITKVGDSYYEDNYLVKAEYFNY